jgi:hypothetical protein
MQEQSRKEMLAELRELLRAPTDGQKLIRPKLLTNVNIVPNEWSIYPGIRAAGQEGGQNNGHEKLAENGEERQEGEQAEINRATIEEKERTAAEEIQNGTEIHSSERKEGKGDL